MGALTLPAEPGFLAGLSTIRMAALLALVAIGIVVGSLALLGLPGAMWLTLTGPLAALFNPARAAPDSAWPMAIWHSMLWPVFLPLAYLVAAQWAGPGRWRVGWTLLLTAAAAMGLAVVFQVRAGWLS